MKRTRRTLQSALTAADFPGEILTGVPVVEIKGDSEAVILNHRGVLAYDSTEIRVSSALGPVTVSGGNLEIFRMNTERIVIHGRVCSVHVWEAEK